MSKQGRPHTIDITVEKTYRRHSGWTLGLVMIALGGLFLLRNYGYSMPDNWWALFLLIPALPSFTRAIKLLGRGEAREAVRPFVRGAVFLFLSAAFFLEWDWSQIWPFFLIAGGVAVLFSGRRQAF